MEAVLQLSPDYFILLCSYGTEQFRQTDRRECLNLYFGLDSVKPLNQRASLLGWLNQDDKAFPDSNDTCPSPLNTFQAPACSVLNPLNT